MKKSKVIIAVAVIAYANLYASDLANPAVLIPAARLSLGASYHLGGYTITNDTVPCVMNRFHARISYSPFSFINFGIDAGATQMEVASETTSVDTFGTFHGKYGFSGGGHLKLGTPFFYKNLVCLIGIVQGTYFSSANDAGTSYSGTDVNGALGLQFHIPSFGFITAGPQVYLIEGKTKDFAGKQGYYSNRNNVRGWLAIDFFPKDLFSSKSMFYISVEASVSPEAKFNARAPVQEFSFSVSIGSITPRLYGVASEAEWKP